MTFILIEDILYPQLFIASNSKLETWAIEKEALVYSLLILWTYNEVRPKGYTCAFDDQEYRNKAFNLKFKQKVNQVWLLPAIFVDWIDKAIVI